MGAQVQQADEYSPLAAVDFDADAGKIEGKEAGVTRGPMDGESAGVLPGHFVGSPKDIAYAFFGASAPAEFYFEHATHSKYADEVLGLLGTQITYEPVPGAEEEINKLNVAASQQFNTKEPKMRPGDPPNAGLVQANLAASPGDLLPSSESALMSLLFDF